MSDRTIRCYDYVNQPYARVRDALIANPQGVFQRATAVAASHAATLHVRVGGLDVGAQIAIRTSGITHETAFGAPATKLLLEWSAVANPGMFPTMMATLTIFPLTPTETQLELEGTYLPPLGKLGAVVDAAVGHRIAEASVTRFIQEVATWLRGELARPTSEAKSPTHDLPI